MRLHLHMWMCIQIRIVESPGEVIRNWKVRTRGLTLMQAWFVYRCTHYDLVVSGSNVSREQCYLVRARSFVHLNKCTGVVVRVSREDSRFFGGNVQVGVTLDEDDDDTSSSFDTEGRRRNVEKESVAGEVGGLDGRTIGNSLIRVDVLIGLLPLKKLETSLTIRRRRVELPTKTISWILESRSTF